MKAEHVVTTRNELRLEHGKFLDARAQTDAGTMRRPARQVQVYPVVACLGVMQSLKQLSDRASDRRRQRRKALAGARFDERTANHEIDFALRL
jgi:hypothetical protein